MSKTRSPGKPLPVGGALAIAALLAGCASSLSELPNAVGGLPAGAPERPAATADYPAVHDMPPARPAPVLTAAERKKATEDLAAARDDQAKRAKAAAKER